MEIKIKKQSFAAFSPVKFINYFGAAIDKVYANNGKALKVLAVTPYSLAANLGLLSDDNITLLGNKKTESHQGTTIDQLNDYLNTLALGDSLRLEVKRNNKTIQLQKAYYPIVIPEARYQVSNSNIVPQKTQTLLTDQILPKQLQANLDQLLLELADYYRANNFTNERIELARSANYDHVYGLLGKIIPQNNNHGIKVTYVANNSPAHAIGLKSDDIIIAINNQPLVEKSARPFTKAIKQLKNNQNYTITLKRHDKIKTLIGKYQPERFIAFKFSINLDSIIRANKQFKQYARTPQKRSRRNMGLFQFGDTRRGYSCQTGVWGNVCDSTDINHETNVSANKLSGSMKKATSHGPGGSTK